MNNEKLKYYGYIISRNIFIDHLIYNIKFDTDQAFRIKCLKDLKRKKLNYNEHYNFLEDLSVSDLNQNIRILAINILINNFFNQSKYLIDWIIQPEHSPRIIFNVIQSLSKVNSSYLKSLLLKNLEERIIKKNQNVIIESYNKQLKVFSSKNQLKSISNEELGYIYVNYAFILNLENKYKFIENSDKSSLHFKLENGVINELRIWGIDAKRISEIDGIERLIHLKVLDLSGNKIKEINALKNLQELILLKLGDLCYGVGNEVTEIKGLDNLKNLKILNLSNNNIKKIEALNGLLNLKRLYLVNNQISEIDGLDNLINLQYLNLEKNQIRTVKNLSGLKNLEILDLSNNFISKLDNLDNLHNLNELRIYKNNISEIKSLPLNITIKIHEIDAQQKCFLEETDLKIITVDESEKPREYDSRYLQ